jgi:hypothetical protein
MSEMRRIGSARTLVRAALFPAQGGWTHPYSTRRWVRCMRSDTPRPSERALGWGINGKLLPVRKTNGRRTRKKAAQKDYRALGRGRAVAKTGHAGAQQRVWGRRGSHGSGIAESHSFRSTRFDCWEQQEYTTTRDPAKRDARWKYSGSNQRQSTREA